MSQLTFAEAEYEGKNRREKFLERMDALIPCFHLVRETTGDFQQSVYSVVSSEAENGQSPNRRPLPPLRIGTSSHKKGNSLQAAQANS